ncbi:MAG: hypothetical protein QOF37_2062 [Thermoleophilaceae bacterium]|nr:hypothetical protein [Thermoleophilaceae bacterium]
MAWPEERRGGGLFATVAARAEAWFLDPAPARSLRSQREARPAIVLAVVGLGRGCGTTTIARALGVELARRHGGGAAMVSASSPPAAVLATAAARRLARSLSPEARAAGRLALSPDEPRLRELAASRAAPLVLDVSHGTPPEAALAVADGALLVASPSVEPSLAGVAAGALAREGVSPLLVLNRCLEAEHWGELPDIRVGESRLAARLALAGRDPLGSLASAVAAMADAFEEVAARA